MSDIKHDEYLDYKHVDEIIEQEKQHMRKRKDKEFDKDGKLYGLALSGGGIRSASFSLGILQAFAKRNCLTKFDYLSSVSGGGYIGSSLSWFLHRKWQYLEKPNEPVRFGVEADNFPFGTKPNTGEDRPGAGSREKMSILRHFRQEINYLFPGEGIGPAALFSAVIRGLIVNVVVYGPVLLFMLMALAYFAGNGIDADAIKGLLDVTIDNPGFQVTGLSIYLELGLYIILFNLCLLLLYAFICPFARLSPDWLYIAHRQFLKFTSRIWVLSTGLLIVGSLPFISESLSELLSTSKIQNSAGITIGGIVSGIWAFIRTGTSKESVIKIPTNIIITVSAALLVYGILLMIYAALDSLFGETSLLAPVFPDIGFKYLFLFLPLFIGLYININFVTIHGYYRDRLMELFMPDFNRATINKPAHAARQANLCLLKDICDYEAEAVGPYHLLNTNIVLPGSKITKFKGRGGDNFILSPLYCGSSATGWRVTEQFNNGRMTLASAMAISGAAVNPSTGSNGEGVTRNYFLSMLMSLLNLRLGYWVENPSIAIGKLKLQPNLWFPGLRDGLLAHRLNEKSSYIELSDGGHFENLAVYELVRRKLGVIVICDGAADKDYTFNDFTNLVEKIRLDFGAVVDINLDALIPVVGDSHPYALPELANKGFAVGNITYNDGSSGHLVYMKTTLIADLPADIYGYKMKHDDYPDESTGDQMFDEKQFEAYRELGYQICKNMLNSRSSITKRLFDC